VHAFNHKMINRQTRSTAIRYAQEKLALHPIYIDTETTGLDQNSEIIEICILDDKDQVIYESLVKPTRSIPKDVIRIHGITDSMVLESPRWKDLWPEVERIMLNQPVGIYNADFDIRMMQQSHARYWMPWKVQTENLFCLMKLYAQYYGEWNRGSFRWHSLENAGRQCGIPLLNTHRARDDTRLARAILHYIAESA